MTSTDTPVGSAAAILQSVKQLVADVNVFRNQQALLYTTTDASVTLTDADGNAFQVPSWAATIALVVQSSDAPTSAAAAIAAAAQAAQSAAQVNSVLVNVTNQTAIAQAAALSANANAGVVSTEAAAVAVLAQNTANYASSVNSNTATVMTATTTVTNAAAAAADSAAAALSSALSVAQLFTTTGVPSPNTGKNGDYAIDPTVAVLYGPRAEGVWPAGISLIGPPGTNTGTGNGGNSSGSDGAVIALLYNHGPPDPSVGVDGDYYIDIDVYTIYGPRTTGTWSTPGTSLVGPAGTQVLNGVGRPDPSVGVEGDFYIDTATSDLYGPQTNGSWGVSTPLIGAPGVNGLTVLNGQGPPSSSLGADGDFYIDTILYDIYGPLASGDWGAPTELIGLAGTNGLSVLNGQGVPDPSLGVEGDFYIDTLTSDLYGPLTGGSWGTATALIGAAGTSILNGQGAPVDGTGAEGDFYIDTLVFDLYGPQTSGIWGTPTSLIGPLGLTGAGFLSGVGAPNPSLGADGDFYFDANATAVYGPRTNDVWGGAISLIGPPGTPGIDAPSLTRKTLTINETTNTTTTGEAALGSQYRLLQVASPQACRFRLYVTAACRDADVSRPSTSYPPANSGLIGEWVFDANTVTSVYCAPILEGASMESSPLSTISYTVDPASAGNTVINLLYQTVVP
jgi:hypothetical protein